MIVTLEFLKSYLGTDVIGSTTDEILTALILETEQDYLNIRNAPFKVDIDTDEIIYPIGSNVTASRMIGFKLNAKEDGGRIVASEKNLSYSVSFGDAGGSTLGGYPLSITGSIKKYVRGL